VERRDRLVAELELACSLLVEVVRLLDVLVLLRRLVVDDVELQQVCDVNLVVGYPRGEKRRLLVAEIPLLQLVLPLLDRFADLDAHATGLGPSLASAL